MIKAYATFEAGGKLRPFEHDPAILNDHDAKIAIEYCGICHSNLSCLVPMCAGMTRCPFVPSHQIVGTISAKGNSFHNLQLDSVVTRVWAIVRDNESGRWR